jgi:hypothetical protein
MGLWGMQTGPRLVVSALCIHIATLTLATTEYIRSRWDAVVDGALQDP